MKGLIIATACILLFASWCVTFSFALDKDAADAHNREFPRHIDAQAANQHVDAINNLGITDAQAFKLVNTPDVKLQLVQQIRKGVAADSIIFLPDTGALDIFDLDKLAPSYGIYVVYASPIIKGNTITNSQYGIYCYGAETKAEISKNNIWENGFGIYCGYQANPAIHFNNIEKNTSYGMYNEDAAITVDATDNWWGNATGPFHPVTNPGGLGNPVSDFVKFIPWLKSPVPIVLLAAAPQAGIFSLRQSYPNPGNPESWFPYSLAEEADVTISIYNASGQLVRTLNLGTKPAGFYFTKEKAAYWDGRNEIGERVVSGVYFYTLQEGNFRATGKMVMLK